MAVVVVCWLLSVLFVWSKAEALPMVQSAVRFDATQAFCFHAKEFVTRFPAGCWVQLKPGNRPDT
jgi:hypothetical protein